MRNVLLSLSLLVIITLAFVPVKPASAFDSFPSDQSRYSPGVHDRIIMEALETGYGFSVAALNRVKYAARNQDWSENSILKEPNENYRAEHHFDSNTEAHNAAELQSRSKTAFINGALYVKQQKEWFLGNLTVCTPAARDLALDALGRALHALEDLFAHSNFVDLSNADQNAVLNALYNPGPEPKPQPPSTLKIAYSPGSGQAKTPDIYSHDDFNKDNWNSNAEAEAHNVNQPALTNFQVAFAKARTETGGFVGSCKFELNNDALWTAKMSDPNIQEKTEIPAGWYPIWFNVTDQYHVGIPDATVNIYFANATLLTSFATNYGGITGWYLPEETYFYEVSKPGYQSYTSGNFVLNTAMLYLNVFLTPNNVGGVLFPIDKFGLLARYIGLASTILAATVALTVYVKRVKRRKEKK